MIFRWSKTGDFMSRIFAILATLVAITFIFSIINYKWITSEAESSQGPQIVDEVQILDQLTDHGKRLKEMLRIKKSVSQELRVMESVLRETEVKIQSSHSLLDQLDVKKSYVKNEIEKMEISLNQLKLAHEEASKQNQPYLSRPLKLVANEPPNYKSNTQIKPKSCQMNSCFDYSRCSITSGFPVYFYEPKSFSAESQDILNQVKSFINSNVYKTTNAPNACVLVVIIISLTNQSHLFGQYLRGLEYWSQGSNHVVINLSPTPLNTLLVDRAILIQSSFVEDTFRKNFDMVMSVPNNSEKTPPQHCPARRQFLACYRGNLSRYPEVKNVMNRLKSMDDFIFELDSSKTGCSVEELEKSTFSLVIGNQVESMYNIRQSIKLGSIPIILGGDVLELPFGEVVDWSLVSILIPIQRVSEVHVIMKSLGDPDVTEMRRMGKMFLERFLRNLNTVIATSLAVLRQKRLQIPAAPIRDLPTIPLFNSTIPMKFLEGIEFNLMSPESTEASENLGPVEPALPSPTFTRNISLTLSHSYQVWNDARFDPFTLFPHTPYDPILPTEAKFLGSSFGFRPIGRGSGGSGKEFSLSLGGNVPREQFTILLLTYERENVLLDSLIKLKGLPYLNKIIVIWNNPHKGPSDEMRWPKLDSPIRVIQADKNSLNNRFKPYDAIETEAILSIDDDTALRHDEIIFGFRVWRENRDRIVGFPGRFHAWDTDSGSFMYNSNYSCELSMVLTGAAFFHKYYSYLYSYSMATEIREIVDKYMNCEDIAMNFLVSHITRMPPVKVTSRWTFRCPKCPITLSEDDSHFQERHSCISLFTKIYGYNPLLNTQFRADSVLFKTRIPQDKQKCFKYV